MTAKTFFISVILAFTTSLTAAEVQIYDPNRLSESKASDVEKCGPLKDQACYNIYYDGAILIKNVPDNFLPYFINYKKEALLQGLPIRARCNPLDADLRSPAKFMHCFYILAYSQIFDSYKVDEIEIGSEGMIKKDYKLILQGTYEFKIDERIHDRIKTLKGSALKRSCNIKLNTGFLDPLLSNYSRCDLEENFKLDTPETNEAELGSRLSCSHRKKIKEAPKCVVCQSEGADLVMQPCAHLCAHATCWQKQVACPVCKTEVKETIHVKY